MINTKFEAYKLKRELKRSGLEFTFKRKSVNEFGEPINELVVVCSIVGIYHEENSNIEITTNETTQVRTKKIPMILCLFSEAAFDLLKIGDILEFNGKTYTLTGIVNVQEWNIIADVSLEVIDDGSKV